MNPCRSHPDAGLACRRMTVLSFPMLALLLMAPLTSGPVWGAASEVAEDCPEPGDLDCDGVPDGSDNCPQDPNPTQTDTDQDGLGDACDTCPQDPWNDYEHDGICTPPDNCPDRYNPAQEDTDADGQGDVCDYDDGLLFFNLKDATHVEWQDDFLLCDGYNLYRGDLAYLRSTGRYTQDPAASSLAMDACNQAVPRTLDTAVPPPGSAVFFLVTCSQGGMETGLGNDGAGSPRPNDYPCPLCDRPFATVFKTQLSGVTTEQYRVIDNLADWCAFWPARCGTTSIDFSTDVAIVAALGFRPDTCFDVTITCLQSNPAPTDIRVFLTEATDTGCECFFEITTPVHVVRAPRPMGASVFSKDTVPQCP